MSRQNEADQGQPATRYPGTIYDQHAFPGHPVFSRGRPWSCEIDKKSGLPVGVIQPKGWRAPWRPPQDNKVFVFVRGEMPNFRLNYEYLLEQRMADVDEYTKERQRAALVRGWSPDDPEKQEALDAIVGRRESLQFAEVVKACMDGNPWILGATDVVDPRVAKYVKPKRRPIDELKSRLPDFSAVEEAQSLAENEEALLDIEEQFDPEASGGKKVPPKPNKLRQAVNKLVGVTE